MDDATEERLAEIDWATNRAIELAETTNRSWGHWFDQALRVACRPDREQLLTVMVESFCSADELLVAFRGYHLTDAELADMNVRSLYRASEEFSVAVRNLGRTLLSSIQALFIRPTTEETQ